MKSSNKAKPEIAAVKDCDTEQDWKARDPRTESIPEHECRLYGYADEPGESMGPGRILANVKQNGAYHNWCESIRIEFDHELDQKSEFKAEISIEVHHACTCHRLACLTFFQWDGGKYVQVPLMDSKPDSKYIILGPVSDLGKIY